MRAKRVGALLVGSFAVYLAVACVAANVDDHGGSSVVDALVDVLLDGAPNDAEAAPTSGTRIKARFTITSTADGAKNENFSGWFDSERNEDCSQLLDPNGKLRCYPMGIQWPSAVFADAACTVPTFLVAPSAPTACPQPVPKYVGEFVGCGLEARITRVFAVGGEITEVYAKGGASGCEKSTVQPTGTRVYTTTGEVPASAFAEMTVTTVVK